MLINEYVNLSVISSTSQLILQPFRLFTYELCSFSKLSVTSPTSQLILQPFRRFTYVTAHSPTPTLLDLRHSSFSNPSFASPTSQALHLIHLASRPCKVVYWMILKKEDEQRNVTRKIMEWAPPEIRQRGRSVRSWWNGVQDAMEIRKLTEEMGLDRLE